ncbi:PAS domain-containing protein [Egicoccus sp. AB-alg2]|uniref:PAS domain-containing protein n=1 Tax=Egicoccus sp. AB-alg2 TaxID=3242693 RepID=UPI00359EEF0F
MTDTLAQWSLYDLVPRPILVTDGDGRVHHANREALAVLRLPTDDAAATARWTDVVAPADVAAAEAWWVRVRRGASNEPLRARLRAGVGPHEVHVSPVEGRSGADRFVVTLLPAPSEPADGPRPNRLAARLADAAPVGLGIMDQDFRFRYVNQELAATNGRSAEEHLGRRLVEIAPHLFPEVEPLLQQGLSGWHIVEAPLTGPAVTDPDEIRHWLVSYFPIELDAGEAGVGVVVRDATVRVRQAEEAAKSQRLLAEAERLAALGSWEWEIAPDVARVSDGLRAMFGLEPDEPFSYAVLLSMLEPADRGRFDARVRDALAVGGRFEATYRLVRRDGVRRLVHERGECVVRDGETVAMFGTVQDITEQAELSERARLWATLAQHLPNGIVVWDGVGVPEPALLRVLAVNPAFDGMYEVEAESPIGVTLREVFGHDLAQRFDDDLRRLLSDGVTVHLGDVRLPSRFGSRVLEVVAFGLPRQRYGMAFEDVTEQRALQQERADLLRRSVTAADDERQRVAEQLHDDVVQSLSAALLRLDLAEQTVDRPLDRIREPVGDAIAVLRRTIMELASADIVRQGLQTAVGNYADRLLAVDGIEVTTSFAVEEHLDDDTLLGAYRIIQEALANVRRHAHATHVRVVVRRTDDGWLRGEVLDDGSGIPDGVTAPPGHLGLRLMRERAEVLGGHVEVVRRRPRGTAVRWRLPA